MKLAFGVSLQGRGVLADRDVLTTLARRAEALGYDSIFVTDRLLIPVHSATRYPYSPTGTFPLGPDEPWLEPLTALTYLATITSRVKVGTSVLVLPYRHPVHVAKAVATADYLSGGRVILGVGIGWWREEFQALGIPFEERAARTMEALALLKVLWTQPRVRFQGRFYRLDEAGGVLPHPVQRPHVPIWIGGHSDGALQRVAAIADGWHPLALRPPVRLDPEELSTRLRRLRTLATAAGRDPEAITVALKAPVTLRDGAASTGPLDGPPARVADDLRRYAAVGVRHFVLDFTVTNPSEMVETLDRFAQEVRPLVESR